jgi:hypothetical protein
MKKTLKYLKKKRWKSSKIRADHELKNSKQWFK